LLNTLSIDNCAECKESWSLIWFVDDKKYLK
jgi:hypothetical protein